MTTKAKREAVWGCWVTWEDKNDDPGWAWETAKETDSICPYAFANKRAWIMPLVVNWRMQNNVKSAVARKVTLPVPEG